MTHIHTIQHTYNVKTTINYNTQYTSPWQLRNYSCHWEANRERDGRERRERSGWHRRLWDTPLYRTYTYKADKAHRQTLLALLRYATVCKCKSHTASEHHLGCLSRSETSLVSSCQTGFVAWRNWVGAYLVLDPLSLTCQSAVLCQWLSCQQIQDAYYLILVFPDWRCAMVCGSRTLLWSNPRWALPASGWSYAVTSLKDPHWEGGRAINDMVSYSSFNG